MEGLILPRDSVLTSLPAEDSLRRTLPRGLVDADRPTESFTAEERRRCRYYVFFVLASGVFSSSL